MVVGPGRPPIRKAPMTNYRYNPNPNRPVATTSRLNHPGQNQEEIIGVGRGRSKIQKKRFIR